MGDCDALQLCHYNVLTHGNPASGSYRSGKNAVKDIIENLRAVIVPNVGHFISPLKHVAGAFYSCDRLEYISRNAFDNCQETRSMSHMCDETGLKYIYADWFKNTYNLEKLDYAFDFYQGEYIPKFMFYNTPKLRDIRHLFHNAWKLKEIPVRLFDRTPLLENAEMAFANAVSLVNIPTDLFSKSPNLSSVNRLFRFRNNEGRMNSDWNRIMGGDMEKVMHLTGDPIYFWDNELWPNLTLNSSTNSCYTGCSGLQGYEGLPDSVKQWAE